MDSRPSSVLPNVDPQELFHVICGAATQDPARVRASSDRLKQLVDNYFGTYDTLLEIASQPTIELAVRQQCIIQFKNKALAYWKSRKYLNDEQRARMRSRIIDFLRDPDELIGETNIVIMTKVARADFPSTWPNLIPDLMDIINAGLETWHSVPIIEPHGFLALRRALKAMNQILKEFNSMKMLTGIKTMGQLVINLHQPFQEHYARLAATLASLSPENVDQPRILEGLLLAHLTLKSLVKISLWVYARTESQKSEYLQLKPWFDNFFANAVAQLQALADLRINLVLAIRSTNWPPITARSVDQLTRHIRLLGKLFRRLQQVSVSRFVTLPMCTDLILYYWNKAVQATSYPSEMITDDGQAVFPVRLLVQALSLFQNSLAQWAPVRKDGSANEHVLSRTFVEDAVKLLVTKYIPLKPGDLEEWMEDPEEWINSEEKDNAQWEFELRPCAERVLMTLANRYPDFVTPLLVTTFQQVIAIPPTDLTLILQREALYCAIGRCALRLKDVIPFDEWLTSTLIPEVRSTNSSYPIIKRRIAWVIGKWVSDECAQPSTLVWEVLAHLLSDRSPGTDAVVRLTAATVIRECVDTLSFRAESLQPFLSQIVSELVRLLSETDSLETKRHISSSLNAVIERAEARIVPLVQAIIEPIPALWMGAGEDWLFRASLLTTATRLCEATGVHSNGLSGIVVPLIRESLAPGAITHLDEDALLLWLAALNFASSTQGSQTPLLELFPIAIPLLAENFELLGKTTSILEGYYLLGAGQLLQPYIIDLFRAYNAALSHAGSNIKDMLISLALLVQLTPSTIWGEAMHISGLFPEMLQVLLDDKADVITLTDYVTLFARIATTDRVVFVQLMDAAIAAKPTNLPNPRDSVWEALMDQWWNRFDNMSEPRYRKLTAMAMANLVSTGQPVVLRRLPSEIFNLWLDVFGELKEAQALSESRSGSPITLYWEQDKAPSSHFGQAPEGSAEYARRQAAWDSDPVRTVQLTTHVAHSLQEAERTLGGPQALEEIISRADPLVTQQIRTELARQ